MKKAVLASIKPKPCELIASGKKTLEIRKNRPKIDVPFKVYIYETKTVYVSRSKENDILIPIKQNMGKVIGEFVCDDIVKFVSEFTDGNTYEDIRYCYLDECNEEQEMILVSNEWNNPNNCWLCREGGLSFSDFREYIGANSHDISFYGWHISDLVIYDKPKELSEFYRKCDDGCGNDCEHWKYIRVNKDEFDMDCDCGGMLPITRPPQSWCYVDELEETT